MKEDDLSWELHDPLEYQVHGLKYGAVKKYRHATKTFVIQGRSVKIQVKVGNFVTLTHTDVKTENDLWVAQVTGIYEFDTAALSESTDDQRTLLPKTNARCSLRWLYRPCDISGADLYGDAVPSSPLAKNEVYFTDYVEGPEMNSLNSINEVVRVVYDEDELSGDSYEFVEGAPYRAAYFSRHFHWVEGISPPKKCKKSNRWRLISRLELDNFTESPSERRDLFWSWASTTTSLATVPARKGTGSSRRPRGETSYRL